MRWNLKHNFYKIILGLVVFVLSVLALEFVCFYWILIQAPKSESVDLIAVFGGDHARYQKGHELANQGLAPYLTISPASDQRLQYFDKTYRLINRYQYIKENRAETTFQNALLVAMLVRNHGIKSLVLVTSDYHMPRSYYLLKLRLIGSDVTIRCHSTQTGKYGSNPLVWSNLQKKRIFNEVIEFWGSISEWVYYSFAGRLPAKRQKRHKALPWMRRVFLFDVGGK